MSHWKNYGFKSLVTCLILVATTSLVWGGRNAWRVYQEAQLNDLLASAQAAMAGGNYHQALSLYQKASHQSDEVSLNLTEIYLRLGQAQSAQAVLGQVLGAGSSHQEELASILNAYLEHQPVETDVYQQALAARELLQKDYTLLAIDLLQKVITTSPAYRDAHLLLGTAYFKNGQAQDALIALEQAAVIDPTYPVTFNLMAQVYGSLGETDQADNLRQKAEFLENP